MDRLICVEDYERKAMKILSPSAKDYYKSGAGAEDTLRWNREAFKRYRIRPRVLRDVSKRDIGTTVLGETISMPLGVSPTAMQRMAHPDGECANARARKTDGLAVYNRLHAESKLIALATKLQLIDERSSKREFGQCKVSDNGAAQAAGTIFTLSTLSTSSIEEVSEAAPDAIKWFQLYVYFDREVTLGLVRRAEKAGYKALVLTVDTPMFGDRRADMRNKFAMPPHLRFANFEGLLANKINSAESGSGLNEYVNGLFDDSLSWDDVTWLRSVTSLPIVLKGILTSMDALLGVKYGASGILVSNHGARQIDGTHATIEVLSEIVEAVGDKVEVYLDGGVTQGTDVLKALALGAKMVFFGRPMIWGLACGGEEGARAVLQIMKSEIDQALALAGCRTVPEVTRDMVTHESRHSRL